MRWLGIVILLLGSALAQDDPPDYDWDEPTRLDTYVHEDDGYYTFELLETYPLNGVTCYILNMTSQNWVGEDYLDRHIWWHHVILAVPDEIRDNTAGVLGITGGDNTDPLPTPDTPLAAITIAFANVTQTVVGSVLQVPNQPTVFANDPDSKSRREDSIIAWTWRTAIDDPEQGQDWVARLPFTKAAKRGMDLIQEFTQSVRPETDIDRFLVTGASKRGWTAWSIAATDRRVIACAPMVFSILNAPEAFMKHYQALGGGWSFAFKPYYDEDLTYHLLEVDELDHLYDMEDMIRYRSRLTMPKLLIVATGDEFFLNHDSHSWWHLMTKPMWMMMNPNAEHALVPHYVRIFETMASFWINVLEDLPMPEMDWTRSEGEDTGHISLSTNILPGYDEDGEELLVRGMRAVTLANDTLRDFRLAAGYPPEPHPVFWFGIGQDVQHDGGGTFDYEVDQVEGEWVGHMLELEYEGPEGFRMFLTSEVNIVPGTFPADPCNSPEECYGYLT